MERLNAGHKIKLSGVRQIIDITRRQFLNGLGLAILGLLAAPSKLVSTPALGFSSKTAPTRVMVLGIDALDYGITCKLMAQGKLPNLASLGKVGTFMALRTSMPPLSPVAWSNFATGTNPGGHGIFDFLGRDPVRVKDGFLPEDAASKVIVDPQASEWHIPFTSYVWPAKQKHVLVRKVPAFWDILEANGINSIIYKMPANYPVSPSRGRVLSGLGTPGIEGTYGTFTYITNRPEDWSRHITGGRVFKASVEDDVPRGRCLFVFKAKHGPSSLIYSVIVFCTFIIVMGDRHNVKRPRSGFRLAGLPQALYWLGGLLCWLLGNPAA